jgi:hypothetical protein
MYFGGLISKFRAMVLRREKRTYVEKMQIQKHKSLQRLNAGPPQWEVSFQVSGIWYSYSEAVAHKIYPKLLYLSEKTAQQMQNNCE